MGVAPDLSRYTYAVGRAQGAWRFAGAELRKASALATVSVAWDIYLRDAGSGDVGPAHETTPMAARLLSTDDPRRDRVLLWLADHAVPAIAQAATTLSRMVGATRRFSADDQALLDAARDALAQPIVSGGPIGEVIFRNARAGDAALALLPALTAAVDRLRRRPGFLESEGAEVCHALPRGTLRHYAPAEPAGCWALNLASLAQRGQTDGLPPGPVSRALFRGNLEPEEIAVQLIGNTSRAWRGSYDRLVRLEHELSRGQAALSYLSRNARTRDAWLLVAALGGCTRTHLARALGLSRAGADIQAHALAATGLATLAAGGEIAWARIRTKKDAAPAPLEQGPLRAAVSDLDASLAEIDRLLAGSTC